MSKTFSRLYSKGFRYGKKLSVWEKFILYWRVKRGGCEDWIVDYKRSDTDFLIIAGAVIAGIIALVIAVLGR